MKSITLVVCSRPDYTRIVLESIRKASPRGYKLFISAEPVCDHTIDICKSVDFIDSELLINPVRLGVNQNNKSVYDYAFGLGSEFNVAVEDDTPLSSDAFRLADWFFALPECHKYVVLNLFNQSRGGEDPAALFEDSTFCPWGYCMTRSAYEGYISRVWMSDERGWDWSISALLQREGLKSLTPRFSRSRNIGRLNGVYCSPQYHDECFAKQVHYMGSDPCDYFVTS